MLVKGEGDTHRVFGRLLHRGPAQQPPRHPDCAVGLGHRPELPQLPGPIGCSCSYPMAVGVRRLPAVVHHAGRGGAGARRHADQDNLQGLHLGSHRLHNGRQGHRSELVLPNLPVLL